MAEYRLGLSIEPLSMGIANTTTVRAADITLVTGKGGVLGGILSTDATPTSDAPLALARLFTSSVRVCESLVLDIGNPPLVLVAIAWRFPRIPDALLLPDIRQFPEHVLEVFHLQPPARLPQYHIQLVS